MTEIEVNENRKRVMSLTLLCICVVAVLTLWFSASAVIPTLIAEYALSPTRVSMFTSSVQAGFVFGTLTSAFFSLADRLDLRRFFMLSAIVASAANAVILLVPPDHNFVIVCRFVTGACMAGVYPVGMKMATTWARQDLGLLVGVLVGALTIGSAFPHLFNAFGGLDWRLTVGSTSVVALAAGLLINCAAIGPKLQKSPPFDPRHLLKAFTTPSLRLANFGYLGHMWELYAMFAWIGVFLDASFRLSFAEADGAADAFWARVATFFVMGVGGLLGCLAAGYYADRYGRTAITMIAMTVSGGCALIVGHLFGMNPILLTIVCFIWGASIVADSAQFSASIAELSDPQLVGTMLTIQTCAGFLLTLITIHLMPPLVDIGGWALAFSILAAGPLFGVISMGRLRRHPDAVKIAGGRR